MKVAPPNPVSNLYVKPSEAVRGPHDISPTENSYYNVYSNRGGPGGAHMTLAPPKPVINFYVKPGVGRSTHDISPIETSY